MARERKVSTFRLDDDLLEGMRVVEERDGVLPSEQARRAIRMWLESKGIDVAAFKRKAGTKKASKRKT